MDFTTVAQLIVSGLTIGCVYSLVGLGFALTLRATDLINFAQGELVTLGAFVGLTLLGWLGLPFPLTFLLTIAIVGAVGVALERAVLRADHPPQGADAEPADRHSRFVDRAAGDGADRLGAGAGDLPAAVLD